MTPFKRKRAFDPLDLEIIDRVYEVAWAQIEARDFYRDTSKDDERKEALRKWVFAVADSGPVEYDDLYEKLTTSIPKPWVKPPTKKAPRGSSSQVGS
jgi:hypothetical protein